MLKRLTWILAAIASVVITLVIFLPASWLGLLVEKQSQGRLSLGDVQGSFWQGSAFIGVAAGKSGPVTPLFPGRFQWHISPLLLLGQIKAELENSAALSAPVRLTGNFSQWHVSPSVLLLPPERLEGLGAPLNTVGPSGILHLSWNDLLFTQSNGQMAMTGHLQLELAEMASRLSPIKPLGSYQMAFDMRGTEADIQLLTMKGPMMLAGNGKMQNGRFQFSGKAWAQAGEEARLANLLNLLGQRRNDGDKDVIALEFK
ncbi:type II secretion system protein N [Undibacterium sp. TS12]|uniref:type II secretion system protein N n=1 Tax=Undibacterium sp. TS12 TaxID=2908202 RepID=UPI001F4C5A1E|nr:type II secretion system protein N [Undibacterium sp. TS12]MCH8618849.1 type II secretion system protein N [Undibacterium sp. TS12]